MVNYAPSTGYDHLTRKQVPYIQLVVEEAMDGVAECSGLASFEEDYLTERVFKVTHVGEKTKSWFMKVIATLTLWEGVGR